MYNYKNKTSEVFENSKVSNFKIKKTVDNKDFFSSDRPSREK